VTCGVGQVGRTFSYGPVIIHDHTLYSGFVPFALLPSKHGTND
jgi:hypothetical protein